MRLRLVISERRACGLVGLARTTLRRARVEPMETVALKARIVDLAQARRRFGYRRIHDLLRREGDPVACEAVGREGARPEVGDGARLADSGVWLA